MHLPGGLHWESVSGGWWLRSLGKSPETRWGLWGILKGEAHLVSRVSPSADLEGFFCRTWWTGAASHPVRMGVAVSRLGPTAFVPLGGVAASVT